MRSQILVFYIINLFFIIMIIGEAMMVYYVYVNGIPNLTISGVKLVPENIGDELVSRKYIGLMACGVLFILLNILAYLSMIKHKLFHYLLFAAPGLLGCLTSIAYTPTVRDKVIAVFFVITYLLGIVATMKRDWKLKHIH